MWSDTKTGITIRKANFDDEQDIKAWIVGSENHVNELLAHDGNLMFSPTETVALCIGRGMREDHLKFPTDKHYIIEDKKTIIGSMVVFSSSIFLKLYPIMLLGGTQRPYGKQFVTMHYAAGRMLKNMGFNHIYFEASYKHPIYEGIKTKRKIGEFPPENPTHVCWEIDI